MGDQVLLTVDQAARRLSVGRTFLYELLRRGVIPSVKLGRSRRVPAYALEAFAREKLEEAMEDEA